MPPDDLSLADHACLAIVAEGSTHGWAIVKLLAPDGDLGRIWSLSRPLTYRSIDRLVELGLVTRATPSDGRRTRLTITRRGRTANRRWLAEPVDHLRDLRTEFLLKHTLCVRSGLDPAPLIVAQRSRLEPTIESLLNQGVNRHSDAVDVWRQEAARAARRFLDRMAAS